MAFWPLIPECQPLSSGGSAGQSLLWTDHAWVAGVWGDHPPAGEGAARCCISQVLLCGEHGRLQSIHSKDDPSRLHCQQWGKAVTHTHTHTHTENYRETVHAVMITHNVTVQRGIFFMFLLFIQHESKWQNAALAQMSLSTVVPELQLRQTESGSSAEWLQQQHTGIKVSPLYYIRLWLVFTSW